MQYLLEAKLACWTLWYTQQTSAGFFYLFFLSTHHLIVHFKLNSAWTRRERTINTG